MSPLLALLALVAAGLLSWALRERREAGRVRERLESARSELSRLQAAFSRFAPDDVIERAIRSGIETHGERKQVTVLFADIVGFTALAERVEPHVLVSILNGYFERMSAAIGEHRGQISTFIGDGILALFGAVEPNPWQRDDAVRAAQAMCAALEDYRGELRGRGLPDFSIGIGLHSGVGVLGLVGSADRMELAFVGRVVNTASRVQQLTRSLPYTVLLTRAMRSQLSPEFDLVELEPLQVRGVAEPVALWGLAETRKPESPSAQGKGTSS